MLKFPLLGGVFAFMASTVFANILKKRWKRNLNPRLHLRLFYFLRMRGKKPAINIKKFYHEGGFGGMGDKFDLIFTPTPMGLLWLESAGQRLLFSQKHQA
jgi:hypothetical protein